MKLEVKLKSKTYSGEFKRPDLDSYATVYNYIVTEPFMADAELAKRSFVSGDKEMIDFDNHLDLLLSYRSELYSVLDIKPVDTFKDGVETIENADKSKTDINYNVKVVLKDGDKEYRAFFKKPAFITFRKVMSLLENGSYFEADQELAQGCIMREISDFEMVQFLDNPHYFASYRFALSKLIERGKVELKKK